MITMKNQTHEYKEYISMLVNTGYIFKMDTLGMFKMLDSLPNEIKNMETFTLGYDLDPKKYDNIVICGMGGSAMGGHIFKSYLWNKANIPIEIVSQYNLPKYVSNRTLAVVISYSGETEETISMLKEAININADILCITSGGTIKDMAIKHSLKHVIVPPGYPPRMAVSFLTIPLLLIGDSFKWSHSKSELLSVYSDLSVMKTQNLSSNIPYEYNIAKQIALKLLWKNINIFSTTPLMYPAALRFKTELNENSKITAALNYFPEMNHNDAEGWAGGSFLNRVAVIFRDKAEPQYLKESVELTKEIIMDPNDIIELYPKGENDLSRVLSKIYIGDYISLYLAILYNHDPGPVKVVQKIKSSRKS